jgi:hypothetical protein
MNRDVVLVVYALVLGWCANNWWRAERERIAWQAADKAREHAEFAAQLRQPPPEPSTGAGTA